MSFVDQITLEELEADPYPIYARLRAEAPVAWIPAAEVWFVTRFQDCSDIGNGRYGFVAASGHPTLERVFNKPNVLTSDGEVHGDLRAGIDPRLTPNAVTAVVDDIVRPVARRRLEALRESGRSSGDLMEDYFEPVSVEALRHVMGLDALVEADTLRRWFAGLNSGIANFALDSEAFERADAISAEIESTIIPLIDELTAHPDDSMIAHMIWAGVRDGRPRSVATIMPSLKVILLGGMQEPGHGAASTLHGLFGRPEQFAAAVSDPLEWAPLAVNEGLRWMAPIGAIERQASVDVDLEGVTIPAGAIVEAVIASANRDESRFDDPDTFDMERGTRSHQAFGAGSHFCAGHFFARQVERIMFEELLPALPGLRPSLVLEPEVSGWFFRAPKMLPVEWDEVLSRETIDLRSAPLGTVELDVTGVRSIAEGIVELELRHPNGVDLPAWTPGAHIDLWAIAERGGQYSLCGDPDDRSVWRVAVLREPQSRGVSRTIHDAVGVGTRMPVGGPRNNFALQPASAYLFIAGGIGVTPLLPLARQAASEGTPFEFRYAGRARSSMAYLDDLPTGTIVHTDGDRLDVDAVIAELPPGTVVYCCGPERMLDAVVAAGERHGIEVHVERFEGVEAIRDGDVALTVGLARSGGELEVPADRSILGALQDRGVEVLTACGEGNCGSCETRVLAGSIDHRDVLLTPAQRAKGDRMMVCVSRGTGLVLDV